MFKEFADLKSDKASLRSFGITVGSAFIVMAALLVFRKKVSIGEVCLLVGVTLLGLGLIFPILLKPIHRVWMSIAILMGWISTRVILLVLFIVIFSPISIVLKILGKDELGLKPSKKSSYWIAKSSKKLSREDHLKQY